MILRGNLATDQSPLDQIGNPLPNMSRYLLLIAVAWTFLVGGLLLYSIHKNAENTRQLAVNEALSNFNKDLAFRFWASRHGGVYVRTDERTPPNPNLAQLKERDLTTPSGKKLTLMNPAYMLRQMMEEYPAKYGVRGRIVSLKPFRPQNSPDPWERKALLAFESGQKVVMQFTEINGQPFLRYFRPIITKQGCLKCHGIQGYKVGDIRGGVGVSVSMTPFLVLERRERNLMLLSFSAFWLLGLGALVWVHREMAAKVKMNKQVELEYRRLEEELHQSEKMASIGTLAGGVAHEFNNILAAIMGFSELALDEAEKGKPTPGKLRKVLRSAELARDLVKQLLVFSRKEASVLQPVDFNQIVAHSIDLLEKILPKMVDVQVNLADDLKSVAANSGQIEQSIINLCSNASHAMPGGGTIFIQTENVMVEKKSCATCGRSFSGEFVLLTVSDKGDGMDLATMKQIFDPFFTTKGVGQGTGLGLAVVHGLIQGHNGHIVCESEPGQGTTFRIYLPVIFSAEETESSKEQGSLEAAGGSETILLVDDEESLRDLGQQILDRNGYRVLLAETGEKALDIYRQKGGEIDLIVLDIGMPGMGGHNCLRELLQMNPNAKVVISSGYSRNGQLKDTLASGAAGFMAKPFHKEDLLKTVRAVLDG